VALSLLTFLSLLRNGFIEWDDPTQIVHNRRFDPPTLAGLATYWTSPQLGEEFYVPLNYTASWLLATVGRAANGAVQPWPYHAAAWLAHAANAVLVLLILHRLTGSRWPAALGAAAFAVHPVQVEPLAWASSLYSCLSGLLALLAVWQYLRFSDARGDRAGWIHYLLATAAFVAAMLTKPTVVTVPLMIAAVEMVLRGRRLRDVMVPLGLWLLLAAPIILLVRAAERGAPVEAPAPPWRALVALDSLAFYLYKLVLPISLAPDYGRSPRWLLERPELTYTWVAPVVLLAVAWHFRGRQKWLPACVLLFVAALLPTLGLVPFDYQRYSTVADRYLYLAMLAPALAVAWLLSRRPRHAFFATAGAAVATLAVLSHVQAYRWRDSRTLFAHTLAVNPRSLAGHVVFGFLEENRGNDDAAMAEFNRALQTNPNDAMALAHVGNIHLRGGRFDDAASAYRAALLNGGEPSLNINLGAALAQAGRTEDAIAALNEAIARRPDSADAHANLGNVLAARGDWAAARREYQEALRLDPNHANARQVLSQLDATGR
jgi:tetratricopeptide (TPR) repeat protein